MYKIKFSQPTSFFNPSVAMRQLPYPTTSAEEQNALAGEGNSPHRGER